MRLAQIRLARNGEVVTALGVRKVKNRFNALSHTLD